MHCEKSDYLQKIACLTKNKQFFSLSLKFNSTTLVSYVEKKAHSRITEILLVRITLLIFLC